MTATETPPVERSAEPGPPRRTVSPPEASPTVVGWFDTSDHKRIGRLYVGLALVFGMLAALLDTLVRLDRSDATGFVILDAETWQQILSLSLDTWTFLTLLPMFAGVALFVVPLQLGNGTVAFPRLGALSFWGYVVGAIIVVSSYGINGGPGGGEADGVDLYLLGLGIVALALMGVALCLATTVLGLRAPGLGLDKVPPFSWSILVWSVMLLVALPALVALLALLYVDHRYGAVTFGGNFGVIAHLDWVHVAPQIFLLAVPTLGVALEIAPVAARNRLPGANLWQPMVGLLAVLGFGAWANQALLDNVFTLGSSGRIIYEEALYLGWIALAGLPLLACLGVVAMTLRGGSGLKVSPELGLALVAVLFTLSGVGAAVAGTALDWWARGDAEVQLRDTVWRDGVYALVVLGGALGGALAAVRWWAPKMYGRTLGAALGWLTLLSLVGGVTLIAAPSLLAGGLWDMSYGPFHADEGASSAMAVLTAIGSLLVLGAITLVLLDLAVSALAKGGDPAGANPVGGHTLEWATGSPPPAGNFDELPEIVDERPLFATVTEEESA